MTNSDAAVIGRKVSGVALVYPDNPSVVSSKLDLRHARSSYKRAAHHSTKPVSHPLLACVSTLSRSLDRLGSIKRQDIPRYLFMIHLDEILRSHARIEAHALN